MKKNIFEEIGFDKGAALNLVMRADLMIALREYIKKHRLTQAEAAKRFGVDQPQVSRLVQGKISHFTVDKLLIMISRVKISISWKIAA